MNGKKLLAFFSCLFLLTGTASTAFGFAYRYPTQSTIGLAKGNAVLTDLEEPSSVFYNPAATAYSEGMALSLGSQYITSKVHHSIGSFRETSYRKDAYIPNVYGTVNLKPIDLEPVTLGFGVSSPYGLSVVYRPTSPIAPVIQKTDLKVANYMISGAYKINEKLSFGSGIDIMHSNAELQRNVDFGALAGASRAMDGVAEFKGSDTTVGFHTGLLFRPLENHSLAFTFRSQQWANLEGKLKVRGIPAFLGLPSSLDGDGVARLNYPAIFQGAYGYQYGKLKMEFMLDWARWENVKDLVIRSTSNPLIGDLVYAADLNNVFTYSGSATYAMTKNLNAHLGFIWAETPVPKKTFNAIVPASDRFALSCGLSYKIKKVKIDTAFQWVHFEGRSIDNNVGAPLASVNGNYSTNAFIVGVNTTVKF